MTAASQTLLKFKDHVYAAAVGSSFFLGRVATEHLLLGRFAWPRSIARRLLRRKLLLLEPHIDADVYSRQFAAKHRRRVARDAALHYALVGRYHNYAPNRDFDPNFYRASTPELNWHEDPLAHFIHRGSADVPTRELPDSIRGPSDIRRSAETVVTINHGRGGGSTKFLSLYEASLHAQGISTLRLARISNKQPLFRLMQKTIAVGDHIFHIDDDKARLIEMLALVGTTRLVFNHFIDIPDGFARLRDLANDAQLPFDVILHDYYAICPRIFLVDRTNNFCNEPPAAVCRSCLRGHEVHDVSAHRAAAESMLHVADRVIVPSRDTADRLKKYWPDRPIEVWNPERDELCETEKLTGFAPDEPLDIAIIGNLSIVKGYCVVRDLARVIKHANLPIRITVIGSSENDLELTSLDVVVHGRYREDEIDNLIITYRQHVVFLPSICPETWSFALTIALRNRFHVTAFDIGAPADRLRHLDRGALLPREAAQQPEFVIQHFLDLRDRLIRSVNPSSKETLSAHERAITHPIS